MKTLWLYICLAFVTSAFAAPLPQTAYFVQNEGQWEGAFAFRYDGGNGSYFVTSSGLTVDLRQYDKPPRPLSPMDRFRHELKPAAVSVRGHVLRLSYVDGNKEPEIMGQEKLFSYSNYFLGRDSCKWRSRVGHYRSVVAKEVWQGIDVEYRLSQNGVETVYHLKPYADPSQIRLRYEGQDAPLTLDGNGGLRLQTSFGPVTEAAPFAYQIVDHRQQNVSCRYQVLSDEAYTLSLGAYDPSQAVVIDPLVYSSYWGEGGGGEFTCVDADRRVVLAGDTESPTFPITVGSYQDSLAGWNNAFISIFTPGGSNLLFSTYVGGAGSAYVYGAVTDAQDAVYIVGGVGENGFTWPLTPDAVDTTKLGTHEGFFARISSDGSELEYSSYLGGDGGAQVHAVQIEPSTGRVYMCGELFPPATSFPVTPDALFSFPQGLTSFLTIFNPATSQLSYSTLIPATVDSGGGNARGMALTGPDQIWICGSSYNGGIQVSANALQPLYGGNEDGFLWHLDLQNNTLAYGTYLGGPNRDAVASVCPLGSGVALAGYTETDSFPTTPDAFQPTYHGNGDGFVTTFDALGAILHSTFLGGLGQDFLGPIALASDSQLFVGGETFSSHFPITADAIDTTLGIGLVGSDAVLCRLSADLSRLEYGTYLGGSWNEEQAGIATVSADTVWVAGYTTSDDFPVTPDALQPTNGGYGANYYSLITISPQSQARPPFILHPSAFILSCYPNPFNPTTTIAFDLPSPSPVTLEVFDVLGRTVWQRNLGVLSAGSHREAWDGSEFASGIYWTRLKTASTTQTRKLVLLK